MISYIDYLGLPATVGLAIVAAFLAIQIIGELLEFKGKVVPEFMKIRKYFARRKKEKELIQSIPDLIAASNAKMESLEKKFDNFTAHYSNDNIHKRDEWIAKVNQHLVDSGCKFEGMQERISGNSDTVLKLLINSHRKEIIEFASYVAEEHHPVTREQFNRIFKLYDEYEDMIEKNGLTNGEVKISYRIISEAYEKHLKNRTFIEDIRGYEN